MNCLSDGALRAYFDNELSAGEGARAKLHLQNCLTCRERSDALSNIAGRVRTQLDTLEEVGSAPQENPQLALARFRSQLDIREKPVSLLQRIFVPRWRFAWAAAVAAAIMITALTFPTARGMAQRLLATLRIEKVQTVRLDLSSLNGNHALTEMLGKMISDKVVITADEKPQDAATAEAASRLAGFDVRVLPERADSATFKVEGQHAFHMSIDRERLQDALDQAGRPDLILPATLDGATVSVQIPRAVETRYGNCPADGHDVGGKKAAEHVERNNQDKESRLSSLPEDCLFLMQAPSPVINVPSDLNLQQLAETALQISGMTPVQARKFCQAIDWRSTLILPIPHFVNSYDNVEVNGAQGTLMRTSAYRGPGYVLIWVKNGIIYLLSGTGAADKAVELANTLG
ncbi:MAG TPA: hypothetical protein VN982_01580 [Candidatus Dormibacteraeota bacterium]|nr:hypothetical protein [Candidatus Dormibacteraeota bacterium]